MIENERAAATDSSPAARLSGSSNGGGSMAVPEPVRDTGALPDSARVALVPGDAPGDAPAVAHVSLSVPMACVFVLLKINGVQS